MSFKFYFCDPEASFGAESPGRLAKRIVDTHKHPHLGIDAWELGSKAYAMLRDEADRPPTNSDLERFIAGSRPMLEEFFKDLSETASSGRITLVSRETGEHISALTYDWNGGDWSWRVLTMVRFIHQIATKKASSEDGNLDHEWLQGLEPHMMVAVLCLLDSAALMSLDNDAAEAAEDILSAAWLLEQVEAHERAEEAGLKIAANIERKRASDRARVRHAKDPKRQARDFVKECWQSWRNAPDQYPSAAAFSRAMLDKQPDLLKSEVVVARWVRSWDKEAGRPPSTEDE
jgi:hypothetical protein